MFGSIPALAEEACAEGSDCTTVATQDTAEESGGQTTETSDTDSSYTSNYTDNSSYTSNSNYSSNSNYTDNSLTSINTDNSYTDNSTNTYTDNSRSETYLSQSADTYNSTYVSRRGGEGSGRPSAVSSGASGASGASGTASNGGSGRAVSSSGSTATVVRGDLDCGDFRSQAHAQAQLEADSRDPHGLDQDNDGLACELYAYPVAQGTAAAAPAQPAAGVLSPMVPAPAAPALASSTPSPSLAGFDVPARDALTYVLVALLSGALARFSARRFAARQQ